MKSSTSAYDCKPLHLVTAKRRRSAGFHVRDRSLLTFWRSVGRLLSSSRRAGTRIPKLGPSTKYVFCKKSARCVSLDSAESGWSAPMAKMHSFAVTIPNMLAGARRKRRRVWAVRRRRRPQGRIDNRSLWCTLEITASAGTRNCHRHKRAADKFAAVTCGRTK
jgi:hypothetical protein